MRESHLWVGAIALAALAWPIQSPAQGRIRTARVLEVVSVIADSGKVPAGTLRLLTEARLMGPQKDSLADSLAAIATRIGRPKAAVAMRLQKRLVEILAFAGKGDGGLPYQRAGTILSQVARNTPSVAAVALLGIAELPSRHEAVGLLGDAATASEQSAYTAVYLLSNRLGMPGRAKLRELFEQGTVVNALARRELERCADAFGWRADSGRSTSN